MSDDIESDRSTDRRSLLRSVATSAVGTAVLVGSASADSESVEPSPRDVITQQTCEEWDCSCCGCDYDCTTVYERDCWMDESGHIVDCDSWRATDECC